MPALTPCFPPRTWLHRHVWHPLLRAMVAGNVMRQEVFQAELRIRAGAVASDRRGDRVVLAGGPVGADLCGAVEQAMRFHPAALAVRDEFAPAVRALSRRR
jgi:hypothetical protein